MIKTKTFLADAIAILFTGGRRRLNHRRKLFRLVTVHRQITFLCATFLLPLHRSSSFILSLLQKAHEKLRKRKSLGNAQTPVGNVERGKEKNEKQRTINYICCKWSIHFVEMSEIIFHRSVMKTLCLLLKSIEK
jgi:hypothetical protein